MMHKQCKNIGHVWYEWEASLDHDGNPSKPPFIYKRVCSTMGCDAVQYAENLQPLGTSVIEDSHDSEKAIADWKKRNEH